MTCIYFCWDKREVFTHNLLALDFFAATPQNPHIFLPIHDQSLFYLLSDGLRLFACVFVLFAQFDDHRVGLTFSIRRLVFGVVNMCQILIEMGLTNLTIIWTGLSYWQWLNKNEFLRLADSFHKNYGPVLRTLIFRREGNFQGNSGNKKMSTLSPLRIKQGVK